MYESTRTLLWCWAVAYSKDTSAHIPGKREQVLIMISELGVVVILLVTLLMTEPSLAQEAQGKEEMHLSYGYSGPFLGFCIFTSLSSSHNSNKKQGL